MKRICQGLIKLYQKYISPIKKPCCKYYPTCSNYAYQAYEKHGFFKGSVLSVYRILRCNPFSKGGVDEVPDDFLFYLRKSRKSKKESKSI